MMRYLIGPELFWLLAYGAANLIARANMPPTKGMDDFIEKCWFYVPLLTVFCFAIWWLPVVEKRWLLLRVWVACIVGGHFVLEKILAAYSTQGPGIGMGYLVGMLLFFVLLIAGSIFVLIKF
ncbi:MAG: hypothetical protein IPN76_28240 [Saprospiraceae bacterium]|jgi:hypothetical protein|nr:hypothetical protein [Saprospiraceae bacterium]